MHFAADVGEGFFFAEVIDYTVDGDAEQLCACRNGLWHYDAAEHVVFYVRDDTGRAHFACSADASVGQVDDSLLLGVLNQYLFFESGPFTFGKTIALGQRDARATHTVAHRQTDDSFRRSHVGSLSPQEVAGFVAAHFVAGGSGRLVFFHFESIGIDVLGRAEGVVTINIDVRMIVFPIDVVSRVPLVGGFVERMLHVVTAVLQRTRCTSLIVYDVDTHFVAIAETVVVDTCHGHLFYLSGQNDGASVFLLRSVRTEGVIVARCQCPDEH